MEKTYGTALLSEEIHESELKLINESLRQKRREAGRRFGVFYMEFFQALMEATKKNVAVCQKKILDLKWAERLKFLEAIRGTVDALIEKGIVKLHATYTGDTFGCREVGFVTVRTNKEGGLDTSNSVRKYEELNCVICNHKLDPLYVQFLRNYLTYKMRNPSTLLCLIVGGGGIKRGGGRNFKLS